MNIAILAHDYHLVRLIELMLRREQYEVACFGKVERLEASPQKIDLLILDPGPLPSARRVIERLHIWQPDTRRVLFTSAYENAKLAREYRLPLIFWPCTRSLFLAVVRDEKVYSREEFIHGT